MYTFQTRFAFTNIGLERPFESATFNLGHPVVLDASISRILEENFNSSCEIISRAGAI